MTDPLLIKNGETFTIHHVIAPPHHFVSLDGKNWHELDESGRIDFQRLVEAQHKET